MNYVENFVVLSKSERGHYAESREWWAFADGTPVAFMRTLIYPDTSWYGVRFVLCDIEVREGYRGRGFARSIIIYAEDETRQKLYSSGHYTPLGAAALMKRMPVVPHETDPGVKFEDMTFVHDWDNLVKVH